MAPKAMDLLGDIISYEQGELDMDQTIDLFCNLIRTRMCWSLQGATVGRLHASSRMARSTRTGCVLCNDCFFCGFVISEEFEPCGDACALCYMMHDITRREPEILDDPVDMIAPEIRWEPVRFIVPII